MLVAFEAEAASARPPDVSLARAVLRSLHVVVSTARISGPFSINLFDAGWPARPSDAKRTRIFGGSHRAARRRGAGTGGGSGYSVRLLQRRRSDAPMLHQTVQSGCRTTSCAALPTRAFCQCGTGPSRYSRLHSAPDTEPYRPVREIDGHMFSSWRMQGPTRPFESVLHRRATETVILFPRSQGPRVGGGLAPSP